MAAEQPLPAASRPPNEPRVQKSSPTLGNSSELEAPQPVEFRGFDFFSKREQNEYKDASRAYFAGKHGDPSSWLGDATPPASLDELRPVPGEGENPPRNNDEPKNEKRILGFRRRWFWLLLGIIGIIIIAVAVGVGVGVGSSRANDTSDAAPTSDSDSTGSTGSTGSTMTRTSKTPGMSVMASPTPTRTSTAAPQEKTNCPDVNGTVYKVPGTPKKFLQLCGVDHGEEDGAIDIRNITTETAQDCIDNCAGTSGCTGCGWGFIEGDDERPPYRCWLKSKVNGEGHRAVADWQFAVLL
ncbi:hypothetical protein F4808DRAFT_411228 [Astrocystis sublimbata]|nr:hypothetical protein F4808DRAFT_411228 [Astrocystis sublimbata]